jgi:Arc/MetJ-type ribon-helix-helix transcriptional regulator
MSVTLYKHIHGLAAIYRQPVDGEVQLGTLVRLLPLRTNIVAAYGRIVSVDLDAGEFIRGKFRKYNDIKVRLLAVVDPITKIPQPIFVPRQQSTIKGWLATNPAGAVMPWNISRMLLTTQTDIDAAVEKYGMPEKTAAAANGEAANNADANANNANANANNANADVINANTHANADASLEANTDHFPDGTTITDYPDVHHDPTPAEDTEDGFIILQHDEHGAVQVTEGAEAERFFKQNGVKGDAFHFMKGMKKTWKKRHGMYQDASGMLRDAILAVEQDKLDEEGKKLAENLTEQRKSRFYQKPNEAKKEAKRRMHCPGAKVLEDIERVIPKPDILLRRVKSAILFVANIRCAKLGEPLFSKESWKLYFDFVRHIKYGCVSDMPNFDYYYYTTSRSGKQKLNCVRGTSQLEGFHTHLHDMFRACHASPLLAVCLLAVFVHRWNHD